MALDATVGGVNSNCYLTLVEAEEYVATRLHTTDWDNASDPDKEAALIWATRLLEQSDWSGNKASFEQALRWPRTGVIDREDYEITHDIVPQFLKDATVEQALVLLSSDTTATPDTAGFSKIKAGSVELEIDKYDRPAEIPDSVSRLIDFALTTGGNLLSVPVIRT